VTFATTAFFLVAMTPSLAAAAPVALEVDPSQQLTLNLGDDRGEPKFELRFLAAKEVPTVPHASLTRFQTTEGKLLNGKVTATVKKGQEGRSVFVTLAFSGIEDAEAGTYTSSLLLLGKGLTDARATVTLALDPKPVHCANLWAVVLLLLGAGLGLFARWIVTVATKLKGQQDRLDVVEARIHGFEPLPIVFRDKLTALRIQLARGSTDSSETTLKELEDRVGAATQVAEVAASIRASIESQRTQIAAMPNLGEAAGKLAAVLAAEQELVDEALRATDFESKDQQDAREGYLGNVRNVRVFMQEYAVESKRAALEKSLDHYARGEFSAGNSAAPIDQAAGVALLSSPTLPPPATPERGPLSKFRAWVVRNAAVFAAGFTAIALVIVGLFTVYHPDTTFRTDAFMDAVGLFAWGLGSAAAGIGVSELTGKLTESKGAATVK
jgi:hypothetical protein